MHPTTFTRFAALLCGLLLLGAAGCRSRSYSKYVPSDQTARGALEAALTAWREGRPPGEIPGASPPVQVVDSHWRSGQKLRGYQILEEVPGEGPRVFSVQLTLENGAAEETVRYVIVGKSPLWVYREDDYKAPAGM
jgi:hypothetical protein